MNRFYKSMLFIITLSQFFTIHITAQNSSIEFMQFSDKIAQGNSMTWEITKVEVYESIDPSIVEEITDTKYPLIEEGSLITVEVLQDVGNQPLVIYGRNEINPNEYFRESVDDIVMEIEDPYNSPQIFLEISNFNLDGSLNYLQATTTDLIYPIAYVYSDNTTEDFVEYHTEFEDKGRTIEITHPDFQVTIHKETGIVLEGDTSVSSAFTPIQISFKLIEYIGDADINIENNKDTLSWNNGFLFLPFVIAVLSRKNRSIIKF